MALSLTDQGVSKSGSPTPKDITPSISFATSKNFLMPEKGISLTFDDTKSSGFIMVKQSSFHLPYLSFQELHHGPCIF